MARGWKPEGRLLVTGTELADWLAVGQPALKKHAEAGHLVRVGQFYDLKASIRSISARQREVASGRGSEDVQEARARLETAKASLTEMKLAQAEGRFIDAEVVERVWADHIRKARSAILAVPSRIRQLLGHIGDMETRVIDRELRDALAALGHDDA